MKQQIELIEETFVNEETNKEVVGVTVIIDDDFKNILDAIIEINNEYTGYSQIIFDALIRGNNKAKEC